MIGKLARSVREYKLPSILSVVFIVFEVILEVFIPLVCSDLINFIEGVRMPGADEAIWHNFNLLNISTGISFPGDLEASAIGYVFIYAAILLVMAGLSLTIRGFFFLFCWGGTAGVS